MPEAATDQPLTLGIETSCDETGIVIACGRTLLHAAAAASHDEHARFGGIVPEVASRAHLEAMVPTIDHALAQAEVRLKDVDAIAVTAGPGLQGSLTVGTAAAKALAIALKKPLYGVNHVIAHAAVDELIHGAFPQPTIALVVSGGRTTLPFVNDVATCEGEPGRASCAG